jgi:hypothetical protein
MAISEKIELLGKGLYKDIPDVLTLKAIPTATELDYVGGEDFQKTMLDIIFPVAIEEQCDFHKLLEIDFQWICRCLRILNYGPYYTTNAIYCGDCDQVSRGEYQVDLHTVDVKELPAGFTNEITITKDEFIDFDGDIVISLPTIQDAMNAAKDPLFTDRNGDTNIALARLCYMVKSIKGNNKLSSPEIKFTIQNKLSSADFFILKSRVNELTDYGLRAGGKTSCPKCHSRDAAFVALVDDRFFRPTLGDLRAWKTDRNDQGHGKPTDGVSESGFRDENISRNASTEV